LSGNWQPYFFYRLPFKKYRFINSLLHLRIHTNLGLYRSTKKANIVNNKEDKQVRRTYSKRGTRREYNHVRIDADAYKDLLELADKLKLPLVEVLRLAIEKLKTSEKTDFQT